jgi:hypothetical protein
MSKTPHTGSHYRESINRDGLKKVIPVIDVRDGIAERMMVMNIIKKNNKSRYINYNKYSVSYKQQTTI